MKSFLTLVFISFSTLIFAQANQTLDVNRIATEYLSNHIDRWQLMPEDIQDIRLANRVHTKHNGVTSLYYYQQYNQVKIYNAIFNINILPSGKVLSANNRFYQNISNKINNTKATLSSDEALENALSLLGLATKKATRIKEHLDNFTKYEKGNIAQTDIICQLFYFPKGKELLPAWEVIVQPIGDDLWSLIVDANTGETLQKTSLTVHCTFDNFDLLAEAQTDSPECISAKSKAIKKNQAGPDGASYRILPYRIESPIFGSRSLLSNPAQLNASPYGWHDTNGADGAEYTITRGNNVHAFLDLNDSGLSQNDEPDGGASLSFDFPFNTNKEPSFYRDASITNLFYMNNFMHDFSYQYGFDENAGNFQLKNYTSLSASANDFIRAQAQDGSGVNNANFSTPPDGVNGTLQMMIFTNQGAKNLTLNSPAGLAGMMSTGAAIFGPPVSNTPITADIVIINDGSQNPNLGCSQTNQDLTGKIALVDRGGSCVYATKAIYAQNKGAIGLIVANFENKTTNMSSPSNLGNQVTIPLVSITKNDADLIKSNINNNVVVQATIVKNNGSGPDSLDSDFSNITIAHEYAHGISNRLTGGGSTTTCLSNDEQMGEGWSDFLGLVLSSNASQTGAESRGLGNYLLKKGIAGIGGRRFPYSTDMAINPLTYHDILNTNRPHPVGEVWAACLWDLYWLMVKQYGFDNDIYTGNGGNNKAIQLVMDGMKLQPCSPGFIDARDALFAADVANNGGANECLIWEAFAKRGLGVSANQGNSDNRNDGTEAYDKPQSCTQALAIHKKMSPVINAGEDILVALSISNFKGENLTGVSVTDIIPANANFVVGSSSVPVNLSGNVLTFDLGNLADKTQKEIQYKLSTNSGNLSTSIWSDNFEFNDSKWETESLKGDNFWNWAQSSSLGYAHSGTHSYFVPGAVGESNQILKLKNTVAISGSKPILRFFHHYNTKPGQDGGILELSVDGGAHWNDAESFIFRESYVRPMSFWTFNAVDQNGFSGNSEKSGTDGYLETMVDLSSFIGQDINIRFHFASHFDDADEKSILWSIDDVEFMDMIQFNSEACVSSNQGDQDCALAPEKGTIVYSGVFVEADQILKEDLKLTVFPNPAKDFINLQIQSGTSAQATLQIININGQEVLAQNINLQKGMQTYQVPLGLSAGVYFLKTWTNKAISVKKIVVH